MPPKKFVFELVRPMFRGSAFVAICTVEVAEANSAPST
jgi:hypothetical protein